LEIVENEEYLEDLEFDEIKRYDIQKRIVNRKINLRKRRELGVKNQGGGTLSSLSTTSPPGFSDLATALQNKKVHSKRRKIQAKTKDRFRLDN
jgi:hypothetical protein